MPHRLYRYVTYAINNKEEHNSYRHILLILLGNFCEKKIQFCTKEFNPCKNGASCLDRGDHYTCQCALGFSGENCTLNNDDCINHMCQVVTFLRLFLSSSSNPFAFRMLELAWMVSTNTPANVHQSLPGNSARSHPWSASSTRRRLRVSSTTVKTGSAFSLKGWRITFASALQVTLVII